MTWWSADSDQRQNMRARLVARLRAQLPENAEPAVWEQALLEMAAELGFIGVALWLPGPDSTLRCRIFGRTVELGVFEEQTRNVTFASGVGMPGRTWLHGIAEWIPDVIKDDNFPRLRGAIRDLVRGVVAFPIVVDGQTIGVIEMYSRDPLTPDRVSTELFTEIGRTIGECQAALLRLASE